jgi:class 3 adenylate cyclase
METRNIAIMLTDIKGFTSKTASFSRAQTQELLAKHRELVLPVIEKFHGRLVKTIGDAFLVAFDSPTDAVICGVQVQEVLKAHNADKPQQDKIEIRIAINAGEVAVHDDGDIYGDAVNITSRLESIAEPGAVFFTEAVYLAMNKKEVPSSEIGYRQFKGIPEKIKVFRVLQEIPVGGQPPGEAAAPAAAGAHDAAAPSPDSGAPASFWRRLASLLTDVVVVMIVLHTFNLGSCGPEAKITSDETKAAPPSIKIENVNINSGGVNLTGKNGETISISKDGAVVKDGKGRTWRKKTDIKIEGNSDKNKVPFGMLLWALYGALLLWRFGATPGMKIMKLKLTDFANGGPAAADKVFLRSFFSLVSLFGLLGYVWALWEKDHRTWHDIIAGTRVVRS